jgi:hypothetical protein
MEKRQKWKRIVNMERKKVRLGAKPILNLARPHKLSTGSQRYTLTTIAHSVLWLTKVFALIQ